jgi:hypothetical protein
MEKKDKDFIKRLKENFNGFAFGASMMRHKEDEK